MSSIRTTRAPRRRQAGSAYLVVLFLLLVISSLGMAMVATTQMEMEIGANERIIQRAFYAAESTLSFATARMLVAGNKESTILPYQDVPIAPTGVPTEARLNVEAVMPVASPPCSFCQINSATENEGDALYQVTHWMRVRGVVIGYPGAANETRLTDRYLTSMVEVQPSADNLPPSYESGAESDITTRFAEIVETEK